MRGERERTPRLDTRRQTVQVEDKLDDKLEDKLCEKTIPADSPSIVEARNGSHNRTRRTWLMVVDGTKDGCLFFLHSFLPKLLEH